MAKTLYSSLFFLSFVVVELLGILPNVKGNILDDFCPESFIPPLCFQMLRNDLSVPKGDIHGLLSTILQIAQDNTTSTYKLVKSILKQPIKDPNVKAQMTNCLRNYNDATNYLKQSNDFYKTGAYKNTSLYSSLAVYESVSCNHGFNEVPSELKPLSEAVQEFSNLSARIADNLK
ncbi:pectinesterase inhibitor-like [Solanum stenotomum]|uniref:pectinesterase inhibitor-like n=1 Tax=Solanum stenotomum TaxID=172797 RepID=UPI0020D170C4|nr:pectinesterase inhibitor-like [Solanum stenotomum]